MTGWQAAGGDDSNRTRRRALHRARKGGCEQRARSRSRGRHATSISTEQSTQRPQRNIFAFFATFAFVRRVLLAQTQLPDCLPT